MLQRLIAAVLGVLGLLAIGLGVASSTVWRGDDVLVATASPDAHLVVGDPGVLELAGNPVMVTVHAADDTPVVIAVGRDTDVAGWVGTDAHAQITGLAGWHALRTEAVAEQAPTPAASASAAPDPAASAPAAPDPAASDPAAIAAGASVGGATAAAADPSGSDLWVTQATGNGTATLTWEAQPGRWSVLVASLGGPSPVVELAWPRTVTTPWLWPGVVGGALLLLIGSSLGVRLWLRARRGLTEPEWHPVLTGAVPTVALAGVGTGTISAASTQTGVLTRRQMREAEAVQGAFPRRRGRGASEGSPTGAQPLLAPAPAPNVPAGASPLAGGATTAAPGLEPATDGAPVIGLSPTGVRSDAQRNAGWGASSRRPEQEPHVAAGSTSRQPVDDGRPRPGQLSGAQVPPRAAPPHTTPSHAAPPHPVTSHDAPSHAAPSHGARSHASAEQPPSTAALPSYFRRSNAPGDARTAPGGPPASGGWVPGGIQADAPLHRPGAEPGRDRSASTHRAAQPDTGAHGGPPRALTPRPIWGAGKPVVADEPTGEPSVEPPGARADAWRRAWGFPGHDAGEADGAAGAIDEGTHR
ncbi:MAG: hypothetical protein ACOH17_06705 [Cellulomonas sp.]